MKKRAVTVLIILMFFSVTLSAFTEQKSTSEQQDNVEVTVYNSNIGLVKDIRNIDLERGTVSLRFMDVASSINPRSVHIKSISHPGRLSVLEQNYEYDLMNPSKLMDKYVGRKVKLLRINEFKGEKEIVEAKLLSYNQNQPIYKIDDEIYLGYSGRVILPEIPENLIARPTLVWLLNNSSNYSQKIEVSYLTHNITWEADYIMVISKNDKSCDMNGWVTINNTSGTTYDNAKLKLIAGDVHRVYGETRYDKYATRTMEKAAAAPQFKEEEFFEYHIYKLQRRSDIKNNQSKQIQLLKANDVSVKKELIVYGSQNYFTGRYREKIPKIDVNVYISFMNSSDNEMGMPLPKGIVRLYKKDSEDALQFIGEDRINHTPKDEEVRVKVGKAFDVVCERIQTDYNKISYNTYETEWEIKVRNHKKEEVIVSLIEPMYADWKVLESNYKFKKLDAHTIRFDVPVSPDEEASVTYRVRVHW